MSEFQDLMKQKREIEERIKVIKKATMINGSAKLDIEHYPTTRPDEWYIAIKVPGVCENDQTRYRSIIRGHSKEECIEKIPEIIKDLKGLYEMVKENVNE